MPISISGADDAPIFRGSTGQSVVAELVGGLLGMIIFVGFATILCVGWVSGLVRIIQNGWPEVHLAKWVGMQFSIFFSTGLMLVFAGLSVYILASFIRRLQKGQDVLEVQIDAAGLLAIRKGLWRTKAEFVPLERIRDIKMYGNPQDKDAHLLVLTAVPDGDKVKDAKEIVEASAKGGMDSGVERFRVKLWEKLGEEAEEIGQQLGKAFKAARKERQRWSITGPMAADRR